MTDTLSTVRLHQGLMAADPSCPRSTELVDLLRNLRRDARMAAAQARAQVNYEWADEPHYQKQIADTQARLARHAHDLNDLWPGAVLEREDDPRGFVVRLVPPNRRGTAWGGGVGVA